MVAFYIIVALGLLFSAYLLYTTPESPLLSVPVAYAGDVASSAQKPLSASIPAIPESITIDGKTIQTREYTVFVANGDSMKNRGIFSGDIVLSKPITNVYEELSKNNVIVLRIANRLGAYKLREFIRVVTLEDYDKSIDDILKSLPNIDVDFHTKLDKCISQYRELESVFLVSRTFDIGKQQERYSIHPASLLEGRVYYKIDPSDL